MRLSFNLHKKAQILSNIQFSKCHLKDSTGTVFIILAFNVNFINNVFSLNNHVIYTQAMPYSFNVKNQHVIMQVFNHWLNFTDTRNSNLCDTDSYLILFTMKMFDKTMGTKFALIVLIYMHLHSNCTSFNKLICS